ncbi:glycosyltransferase family 2 protein [Spelaeicoccus albus]|uniref:Glycosyltransferase involved in cell wall biosynthesis n=1 Tax=Spelaeicoccus albus TaxID=1280376 RepID=A0A7Z0IJ81_9MICO|nr:glycosyltransferase family A protein [Spelaeicoccus albus]NYI69156.1 glycosyltransferase involved in cell wall biosynthesis [Spelaeicoccus albus]
MNQHRKDDTATIAERSPLQRLPLVSVVIPTYNRPDFLRQALASVLNQDYCGPIEAIVVFDKTEPDYSLESERSDRSVRVFRNTRTPGLAGNRNSGILKATGELVAFCDDDDTWRPNKLSSQVRALHDSPQHDFVTTAMAVDFKSKTIDRLAGRTEVDHSAFFTSRMAMLHSSSFMARRSAFLGDLGLVDETLPQSMAEDRELLIRATQLKPILHVDEPLINVRWAETSYFAQDWKVRNEASLWLLKRYPELHQNRTAAALSYGKLAFGNAALRHRREALSWARRAFKANWREPRTYLATAVVSGLSWRWVMKQLNGRGRGI